MKSLNLRRLELTIRKFSRCFLRRGRPSTVIVHKTKASRKPIYTVFVLAAPNQRTYPHLVPISGDEKLMRRFSCLILGPVMASLVSINCRAVGCPRLKLRRATQIFEIPPGSLEVNGVWRRRRLEVHSLLALLALSFRVVAFGWVRSMCLYV